MWEPALFIVCQSGYTTASEEMFRLMEQAEAEGKTCGEFLAENNTEISYLAGLAKRNRERLMASFAQAIGMKLDYDFDAMAVAEKRVFPKTLPSLIETTTNRISLMGKKCVYFCGTADPSSVRGMVFNQTPYLGPLIVKGPNPSETWGGSWSVTKPSVNGYYPTCLGRRVTTLSTNPAFKSLPYPDEKYISSFCWEASTTDVNPRLKLGIYHKRDFEFMQYERSLGLDNSSNRIIQLEPLKVKIFSQK